MLGCLDLYLGELFGRIKAVLARRHGLAIINCCVADRHSKSSSRFRFAKIYSRQWPRWQTQEIWRSLSRLSPLTTFHRTNGPSMRAKSHRFPRSKEQDRIWMCWFTGNRGRAYRCGRRLHTPSSSIHWTALPPLALGTAPKLAMMGLRSLRRPIFAYARFSPAHRSW